MYSNKFIPIKPEDVKKVNACELASKYNVSSSYISRVLKSDKEPTSLNAQNILNDARSIIKLYVAPTESQL